MVLVALMMIFFVAMISFAIDYGYILTMETDLQRAADAAALAAVQDLLPQADGSQDLDAVRAAVRTYAEDNLDSGFQVSDADIQIGRFDTSTIYQNVTLLNSGVFDAVRVTLRRDGAVNDRFPLFFAQILGVQDAGVTASATAVLQKPCELPPGSGVLPFAVPFDEWGPINPGDTWTIYGDGKMVGFTIQGSVLSPEPTLASRIIRVFYQPIIQFRHACPHNGRFSHHQGSDQGKARTRS